MTAIVLPFSPKKGVQHEKNTSSPWNRGQEPMACRHSDMDKIMKQIKDSVCKNCSRSYHHDGKSNWGNTNDGHRCSTILFSHFGWVNRHKPLIPVQLDCKVGHTTWRKSCCFAHERDNRGKDLFKFTKLVKEKKLLALLNEHEKRPILSFYCILHQEELCAQMCGEQQSK